MLTLINLKRKMSTSFSLVMSTLVNQLLPETLWNSSVKLMNNNWQETSKKPRKIICKHGNWLVLLMLILMKEKEERLFNMLNLTFLLKTEDSQFLTPRGTKTTSLTWSWVLAKLISLFSLFLQKKVSSRQDSIRMAKPNNTLC